MELSKQTHEQLIDICISQYERSEKAEAEVERLRKALRGLLLLVEHKTDLPMGAANGVEYQGIDEGEVRATATLEEAQAALGGGNV